MKRVSITIFNYKLDFYYLQTIVTEYYVNKYSYYLDKKKVTKIIN
jgi:hypothetical protein